jgi:hypothetical protein
MVYTIENGDLYYGLYSSKTLLESGIIKNNTWQLFTIFFNATEGCRIFNDDNLYVPDGLDYAPFSIGTPSEITGFKIAAKYDSSNPKNYGFWIDDISVQKIVSGFMLDTVTHLTNLQYSFDGQSKKSFNNLDTFSFPSVGEHSIVIYGTDTYGNEFQSENRTFSSGETYNRYEYIKAIDTPDQWSEFEFIHGNGETIGDLADIDDEYCIIKPRLTTGYSSYETVRPDGDVSTGGWVVTPNLWDKVNDPMDYPSTSGRDYTYISGEGSDTVVFNMQNTDLPGDAIIDKVEVFVFLWILDEPYSDFYIGWKFDGYTSWLDTYYWWDDNPSWAWAGCSDTVGGSYGDSEADNLQVRLVVDEWGMGTVTYTVESVHARVHYYIPDKYDVECDATWVPPSSDLYSIDSLSWRYRQTVSQTTLNMYAWNWVAHDFDLQLDSATGTDWEEGSWIPTGNYLSESNQIRVKWICSKKTSDFELRIDKCAIENLNVVDTPNQWSEFSFTYGSAGTTGDLQKIDNNYCAIDSRLVSGVDTYATVRPNGDASTGGWTTAPLYLKVDESMTYPSTSGYDGQWISGNGHDTVIFNMDNTNLPSDAIIDKIEVFVYMWFLDEPYASFYVGWRFNGFTSWVDSFHWYDGTPTWAWFPTSDAVGGSYGDAAADNFQVRLVVDEWGMGTVIYTVESVHARIHYTTPNKYDLQCEATWAPPSTDLYSIEKITWRYSQTVGTSTMYMKIYNWDTQGWTTIDTASGTAWEADTYVLTNAYIQDGTNKIKVRWYCSQKTTNFDLRIDQCRIEYTKKVPISL